MKKGRFVLNLALLLLACLSASACTEFIDYPSLEDGDSSDTCLPPDDMPSCAKDLQNGDTLCFDDSVSMCKVTWIPAPSCQYLIQMVHVDACLYGCEQITSDLARCAGGVWEDGDVEEDVDQDEEEPAKWPETKPICSMPNQEGWCWEMPLPAGGSLKSVAVRGDEVWFAGISGLYYYKNGSLIHEDAPVMTDLQSIWLDPDGENILAVGPEYGLVWWDDSQWNSFSNPGQPTLRSISGQDLESLWVVGDSQTSFYPLVEPLVMQDVPGGVTNLQRNCQPVENQSFLLADNTGLWSINLDGWEKVQQGEQFTDLWCKSSSELFYLDGTSIWRWVVGSDPQELLSEKYQWNAIAGRGRRVWAVNNEGWASHTDIYPGDTPSWVSARLPFPDFDEVQLYDIAFASDTVVWAVGSGGSIFRYDPQSRWRSIVDTPQIPWRAVSVIPVGRTVVVGRQGASADYANGSWSVKEKNENVGTDDFIHVLLLDEDHGFAMTETDLYRLDQQTWTLIEEAPMPGTLGWLKMLKIPGLDLDDRVDGLNLLLIADKQGTIWQYLNGQWVSYSQTPFQLTDIWISPGRRLWAVGDCRSCVARYNQTQWSTQDVPDAGFQVITGSLSDPSLVYALTSDSLWRFNGKWFTKADDVSFEGNKVIAWAGNRERMVIISSRFEGMARAYEHFGDYWTVTDLPADGRWYGIDGGSIPQGENQDLLDLRIVGEYGVLRRFGLVPQ